MIMNVEIDVFFHLIDKTCCFSIVCRRKVTSILTKIRFFEVSKFSKEVLVWHTFLVEKFVEFIVFLMLHSVIIGAE